MSPRERDALVAETMGFEPEIVYIATNDGGESSVASTHRGGPWSTRDDLAEWLAGKQERGLLLGYGIGELKLYPRYTSDIAAAWEVVEKMRADGWRANAYLSEHGAGASFEKGDDNSPRYQGFFSGMNAVEADHFLNDRVETVPEALALAALRAKGVEV